MNQTLSDFMTQGVFAFILTFVRIGSALMIMPGIGDSFTPRNVRLYSALALSFVMAPLVQPYMPHPIPPTFMLFSLIIMEFLIGIFIGTITRFFLAALDTAGMLISLASGLGSAQLFNPAFITQGSLVGSFLSVAGVVMIFVTNTYQLLFGALIGSYRMFPVGSVPDTGSMAEMLSQALSSSFLIAFQISAPFMVMALILYIAMGVLSRLMPQIQIFMLAVPLQITLSLIALTLVFSSMMMFWLTKFQDSMVMFLHSAG